MSVLLLLDDSPAVVKASRIELPAPVGPAQGYRVVHYSQNGVPLGEAALEQPNFGKFLNRPETINYTIDLSHKLATRSFTEAYGTDWLLFKDDVPIMGGLHTEVSVEDFSTNELQVAGQGWLHYLERRLWPFDPANPTGNLYSVFARDIFTIVEDILTNVLSLSESLVVSYSNGSSGQLANYNIEPGDTEFILSKVDTLSKMLPGFDYEMTWDRQFKMYAPKKGVITNLILEQDKNIIGPSFADKGPGGTSILGLGSGTSIRLGALASDVLARLKYRRLDNSVDFGELSDPSLITSLVAAEIKRQITPQKALTAKWVGDDDIWQLLSPGDSATVRGTTGYEEFDDLFRIVGMEGSPTETGDEEVTLTFDDGSLSL